MVPNLFEQTIRVEKLGLRLGAESGDDIRREHDTRIHRANLFHQSDVFASRISPIHHAENAIVAGLRGQVDVLADFWMKDDGLQQRRRKIFGVRRSESYPL